MPQSRVMTRFYFFSSALNWPGRGSELRGCCLCLRENICRTILCEALSGSGLLWMFALSIDQIFHYESKLACACKPVEHFYAAKSERIWPNSSTVPSSWTRALELESNQADFFFLLLLSARAADNRSIEVDWYAITWNLFMVINGSDIGIPSQQSFVFARSKGALR